MAILKVLKYGDERLRQKSKEVSKVSKKIQKLVEDMLHTMYAENGVGLAAAQVGELLRVVVIDISPPDSAPDPIVLINPKIIKKSGAMNSYEGCLSFPKAYTDVRRYASVTVKALDKYGKPFLIESKPNSLLSKALQHELDHLDGILFIDHCRNIFEADKILKEHDLQPVDTSKLIEENELEEQILISPPEAH